MCNSGRVSTKRQRQKAIKGDLLPAVAGFTQFEGLLGFFGVLVLVDVLFRVLSGNGPSLFPHHLLLSRVFRISPCELPQ